MARVGTVRERPSRTTKKSKRYRVDLKALGLRVRQLRQGHGWTLQRTAEECSLDLTHLQKIEAARTNVSFATLVRLAECERQLRSASV